jgi:CBS domain-containing protein
VLDEHGKALGIITARDILRWLADQLAPGDDQIVADAA